MQLLAGGCRSPTSPLCCHGPITTPRGCLLPSLDHGQRSLGAAARCCAVPCHAVLCVLLLAARPRTPGQLSSPPAAARGRRAVQLLRHGGCFEIPGLPSVLCKSPNLTAVCGPASGPSDGSCYYLAPPPFQHPAADLEQQKHHPSLREEA